MERIFCPVEEESGKRIRLKGKRNLYYRKFARDEEKDGTKESIIKNSVGYVILKDLKKQKTTGDKPEKLQNVVEDELHFFDEKYVIYKNEINGKAEPEWKTDYLKSDEDDIYKLKDSRIKGYFVVQNEGSESTEPTEPCLTTVLLVSKKKIVPILLIFLLLLLTTLCVKAFYNPKNADVPIAESPAIEFAEDSTEYDDTPIMTEEKEQKQQNSNIELNLFVDQTLSIGDTIPFANYSTNIDNLEFQITYAGENEVIYDTGVIGPGQQVKWNVSDTLEAGKYCFDIYLLVYPADGTEVSYLCFQKNFHIILK